MRLCDCCSSALISVWPSSAVAFPRIPLPLRLRVSIMNLDESLMNFVNILGISIFGAIALFHYVQSAAKNQ